MFEVFIQRDWVSLVLTWLVCVERTTNRRDKMETRKAQCACGNWTVVPHKMMKEAPKCEDCKKQAVNHIVGPGVQKKVKCGDTVTKKDGTPVDAACLNGGSVTRTSEEGLVIEKWNPVTEEMARITLSKEEVTELIRFEMLKERK